MSDNHDAQGQFMAGNQAAKGENRTTVSAKLFRRLIRQATTREMVLDIWLVLYSEAKSGQSWAVKLFLDYTAGKPEDEELSQRMEELETLLEQLVHERQIAA